MNIQSHQLAEQFDSPSQQKSAATLGMWVFLATEALFFGGLFLAYSAYRISYPDIFTKAAINFNLAIGTINTVILLVSSFFMALAVFYSELGKSKRASYMLSITWLLGASFLALKAYEYYDDVQKNIIVGSSLLHNNSDANIEQLFYLIYYIITGLHAIHVIIGLVVIAAIIILNNLNKYSKEYYTPVEITGLYWHFVDIIWIFIYPLLYLVGRSS
jgi:cytochrome c oxidase subunit 3